MHLINLVNAYTAAEQMRFTEYFNGQKIVRVERELPFEQASALVSLCAIIKPHYNSFAESERALIDRYAKKDENGNPVVNGDIISFATVEDKNQFDSALKELQETEVSVEGIPIKMPRPATVRCSWLEALEGIVEFI